MEEKCFCHLGGYAVKDAAARKMLADLAPVDVSDAFTFELKNPVEALEVSECFEKKLVYCPASGAVLFKLKFSFLGSFTMDTLLSFNVNNQFRPTEHFPICCQQPKFRFDIYPEELTIGVTEDCTFEIFPNIVSVSGWYFTAANEAKEVNNA